MSASDDPAERSIRVVKGIRHTPERNYGAACVDLQGVPWSIHERWMTFVRAPTATKFPAGVPARPVSLQPRPEANSWTGGTPSAISKHEETKMFGKSNLEKELRAASAANTEGEVDQEQAGKTGGRGREKSA